MVEKMCITKLKGLLLYLLMLSCVSIGSAAQAADLDHRQTADLFIEGVSSGNADKTIKTYMRPDVLTLLGAGVRGTITQLDSLADAFGGYQDTTILHEEKLTERLYRYIYILHTPTIPVAFELFVYRTEGGWHVSSFEFDTDMEVIFPAK